MSCQLIPLNAGGYPAIPLQRPVLLIGRHPECDVRLDLTKISRRHCCLALAYDRVVIRDLGSRNGLRVNGRLVDEARLQAGDEVAIGPILYRVDVVEAPPIARVSAPPLTADSPKPSPSGPSSPETIDPEDPDGDLAPITI